MSCATRCHATIPTAYFAAPLPPYRLFEAEEVVAEDALGMVLSTSRRTFLAVLNS